ncbi:Flavodoxin domain-containing protein [Desulfatibacillum alkenivorans DSM 16219]|jgi:ferredoxin|uniref:Flavodoxin domain-containing protein n=1 Tax=Desulfatibacillum alkenivorans DSM 16219 TaxID=1121393 RepID=A0A1M6EEL9_9BACT|nr:EFR1 family ferrodoxin [Desulfatibacillum alkenivorans]SHI83873.1 Flavodoxin domain-containing protein [Desulfatibacillum alkenivorans DSM 16219]
MKIAVLYFSATGNTKKMADVIEQSLAGLGAQVEKIDVTVPSARRESMDFSGWDGVIFGAPIHSMRAPRVLREWLQTLNGQGKKAAMYFTYGGFHVHPCHYSTREILAAAGFTVVASAEFLGAHTFNRGGWQAVPERPDASDFAVAKDYAAAVYARFSGKDAGVLGELEKTDMNEEFLDAIEGFRFKALTQLPTRNGKECSLCMACQEQCPSGAMDAEKGEADPALCIACLGCLDACPEDALEINDMSGVFAQRMEMEKSTPQDLNKKQSKIYL